MACEPSSARRMAEAGERPPADDLPAFRTTRSGAGRRRSRGCRAAGRGRARGRRRAGWPQGRPEAARIRAAGGFALDCRTGRATARAPSAAAARAPAPRGSPGSAPQASGKRRAGLGTSSVTAPGSSALERRARARAELGQRGERRASGEEHDRGGLVRRAALELVQALRRRARPRGRRRARRPCRREDRDAAARRGSARGARASRGVSGVMPPRRARCRRGRGGAPPRRSPRRAAERPTAPAWPSPTSNASRGGRARRGASGG